ncbi:MAG: hypothetical protein V9G29_13895 [Burkholderiaceae bacterium]|jgi:hypothetical protein
MVVAKHIFLCSILAACMCCTSVQAAQQPQAWSESLAVPDSDVPSLLLPIVDRSALLAEDEALLAAAAGGSANKRMRVARGSDVSADTTKEGTWQTLADGSRLWRLRVLAPQATDLQIGFARFQLPEGATVFVYSTSERYSSGPYRAADVNPSGQLWAAMVPGEEAMIELHLPAGTSEHQLEVTYVGAGYRDMFSREGGFVPLGGSGACNINVACALGNPYPDQIRSVARYTLVDGGTYLCSGSLVTNAEHDGTPYFLTAAHCVSTNAVAGTMTFYWNYQSTQCATNTGASMAQNQSGATLRMTRANVDTTLVQLTSVPAAEFNVFYSGWDATGTTPAGTIGIHHPSGDVKKITEDANGISTMNNCIGTGGGTTNTHWRTGAPYTQGTTEGGSSGSGIWIPAGDASGGGRLVIGVLSGGTAQCSGSVPNSGYDCYGKLSVAFTGSNASQRLKDWLDPNNSGVLRVQGSDGAGNDTIFKNGFE